MKTHEISRQLSSRLGLETPAVALALVDEAPPGVETASAEVPSSCAFWRKAEEGVFFASAAQHLNCPVGAMVMGFELPQPVMEQLTGVVGDMCECSYLAEEEVAQIPSMKRKSQGAVYGPLAEFPVEPDVILLWLTPRQAMLFGEAAGTCGWQQSVPTSALGRPACAALPSSLDGERPTVSLGCLGMRTFTEIGDDRLLAVLPGGQAEEFASRLRTTEAANEAMGSFYRGHKASFA